LKDAVACCCAFENHKGGSGYLTVRRGARTSQLPMHSSRKELGTSPVNTILKDLGSKPGHKSISQRKSVLGQGCQSLVCSSETPSGVPSWLL
jgi:mRNA interferase HicA